MVRVKRIYEAPAEDDGLRVLVDRLWPRGLKKENARVDQWLKDLAPSDELRKWFGHDPERWKEFREKYQQELHNRVEVFDQLREESKKRTVTLLFAAKDEERNNAVVLKELLTT